MPRLHLVDPEQATGRAKELLEGVRKGFGMVPNLTRVLANSPAVLQGYLALGEALGGASLSRQVREQLALTVAEVNGCGYCLSAHTMIGAKAGLAREQMLDARRGVASDAKTAAILKLARSIVTARGQVRDADLTEARAAGVNDAEIAETLGVVVLNVMTNWINLLAATPIDFPEVKPGVDTPARAQL